METEIIKPESKVRLVGLTGPYRDCTYLIDKDEFLVGRSPECHLILDETTVSGRHARIVKREGQYELQDLKSTNGTFVEGVKVEVKKLRSEDRIRFDRFDFRFINPLDVSRTVVGEAPGYEAVRKTVFRGAESPKEPAAPSPRYPSELPHPAQESQPPAKDERARSGAKGSALAGFVAALLVAYLLGVIPMAVVTFTRTAAGLDTLPRIIVQVVSLHPGMHLHPAWINADFKDASVILVAAFLFLGIVLGGLITQNARRRGRFVSALFFALGFVLLSLLLQAASMDFNFAGLPMAYPQFFAFLGTWGNFGLCAAYFFAVSLILSWFGALLGRRKR